MGESPAFRTDCRRRLEINPETAEKHDPDFGSCFFCPQTYGAHAENLRLVFSFYKLLFLFQLHFHKKLTFLTVKPVNLLLSEKQIFRQGCAVHLATFSLVLITYPEIPVLNLLRNNN